MQYRALVFTKLNILMKAAAIIKKLKMKFLTFNHIPECLIKVNAQIFN